MKKILPILLLILASCTKGGLKEQTNCQPACLLSDKFTKDSLYVRTDTLWKDNKLCGHNLDSIINQPPLILKFCADSTLECWRYVIGYKITHYSPLK